MPQTRPCPPAASRNTLRVFYSTSATAPATSAVKPIAPMPIPALAMAPLLLLFLKNVPLTLSTKLLFSFKTVVPELLDELRSFSVGSMFGVVLVWKRGATGVPSNSKRWSLGPSVGSMKMRQDWKSSVKL